MFYRSFRLSRKPSRRSGFRPLLEPLERREVLSTALPPGFSETTLASGFNAPTNMDFAPGVGLFILEQGGTVKFVRNNGTSFTSLTLTVDSQGERGLLGIAFDPNFQSNHFAYLYYTNPQAGGAATGVHNQISRFTVNVSNLTRPTFGNETPILDLNNLTSATNHNGGGIHFGADGMLYVGVGENANPSNSQTLANLLGKLLRVNVDGYAGVRDDTTVGHIIPADNPFVGTATGINQLIYDLGLRNPYTFAVQPGTGTIFINDVGENTWEEIDKAVPGGNYGWPNSEGFKQPGDTNTTIGTYQNPLLAYNHSGSPGGCALVGGTFYDPKSRTFPKQFLGKYFYEDLCGGWIRLFDPANPGTLSNPDTSSAFATGDAGNTVALAVDQFGRLFYLSRTSGQLERITYKVPAITPSHQTVAQGSSATFSVTTTGAGPLNYQWQHLVGGSWINVGFNSATFTIASVSTADQGSYRVIVSNSLGSATSNNAGLTVNGPFFPHVVTRGGDPGVLGRDMNAELAALFGSADDFARWTSPHHRRLV